MDPVAYQSLAPLAAGVADQTVSLGCFYQKVAPVGGHDQSIVEWCGIHQPVRLGDHRFWSVIRAKRSEAGGCE